MIRAFGRSHRLIAAADSVGSGTWLDMENVTLPCVRAGLEDVTTYKYVFSRWVP